MIAADMANCRFRTAALQDAPALAALGRETFIETFGHLYQPDDLAAFLISHDEERWREQLAAELTQLSKELPARFGGSPAYARTTEQHTALVTPMLESLVGPAVNTSLWVLLGAVGVVIAMPVTALTTAAGMSNRAITSIAQMFRLKRNRGGDICPNRPMKSIYIAESGASSSTATRSSVSSLSNSHTGPAIILATG